MGGQNRGVGVRRMYPASFVVREYERRVTVAMYQGDGAEKTPQYSSTLWLGKRQQTLGDDGKDLDHNAELIPRDQFLHRFAHSPILTRYIWGYCATECKRGNRLSHFSFPKAYQAGLASILQQLIHPLFAASRDPQ
ncbi:hypothetical protein C8R45DRAFT_1080126 [Mycena sanguinolenta]|nr:hypothetical protein C8R45DRAFT_1080126 [Mycena sanguinolenta]